jgi:hypothetical protein
MEQNLEHKTELKDRLIEFYKRNKIKVFSLVILILFLIATIIVVNVNYKKKNSIIGEKYIEAGLYLASGKKNKTTQLYEEIIFSKNKFYSILALNNMLENNLQTNENKILNYFETVENLKISKEQKQILLFKKALYLIKISKIQEGNNLLSEIIESKSNLSPLAKEILDK